MSEIELPTVPDVKILRLLPGDTLVYRCEQRLDDDTYAEIKKHMTERFPGHLVVVLDCGATIEVLRAEGGERR